MATFSNPTGLPRPAWLSSFVKFGIKGAVGLGFTVALLTVAVDGLGLSHALAAPLVWAVKVVPGYIAVDKWVFDLFPSPDGLAGHGRRGAIFYAVQWSGKALNYLIYLALIEFGLLYQGAWIVGALAVFPLIFGVNWLVWERQI